MVTGASTVARMKFIASPSWGLTPQPTIMIARPALWSPVGGDGCLNCRSNQVCCPGLVGLQLSRRSGQTLEASDENPTGRIELLMDSPSSEELVRVAADRLLSVVIWSETHVLRGIFSPAFKCQYNLRPRRHDFVLLTNYDKTLYRESYIVTYSKHL